MKRILDACCGGKMGWFDKHHPDAVYMDIRSEVITFADGRKYVVDPDVVGDFKSIPFPDESFSLVYFDPPHMTRISEKSVIGRKFGKLPKDWQTEIISGFRECMRVLKPDGVLVFKWSEAEISVRQLLDILPIPPLFGHTTGKAGRTKWMVFMKPNQQQNNI